MGAEKINLEGLDIKELEDLIDRIHMQIHAIKEHKREEFMKRMEEEAEKEGIPFNEIIRPKRDKPALGKASDKRAQVQPKYRDSEGNEWTGRGRAPKWVLAYLGVEAFNKDDTEQAKKMEEILIKKAKG